MYCWMKSVELDVALEQVVARSRCSGCRRWPPGLSRRAHGLEVASASIRGRPPRPSRSSDRVVRAVVDVAVVLQAQVDAPAQAGVGHALAAHTSSCSVDNVTPVTWRRIRAPRISASAPQPQPISSTRSPGSHAAVARARGAPWPLARRPVGCVSVAVEPGARVVHRRVQPQPVERVAEVVVGVDVLAAAGARVAVAAGAGRGTAAQPHQLP